MVKLENLNVYSLPESEDLGITSGCCDGSAYAVEVKTGSIYRTYSYAQLEYNKEFKEVGQLTMILELIEKEFQVPWNTHSWAWAGFVEEQLEGER